MEQGPAPTLESLVSILNVLDEGVLVEDARGKPLYWNASFSKFFGIRHGDFEEFREIRDRLGGLAAQGGAEFYFTTLRGERKTGILRSRRLEFSPGNALTCFLLREVTELKLLEEELRNATKYETMASFMNPKPFPTGELLEAIHPGESVGEVLAICDDHLRIRSISVTVEGPNEVQMLAERSALRQVLLQLLRASCDVVEGTSEARVGFAWSASAESVEIRVHDSGIEESARNAAPAEVLRRRLSVQLVERMGGALEVAAGGTQGRFLLRLPRVRSILRI